jgi:hypothetical protein
MGRQDQGTRLNALVREWPGVESMPHRFGGLEFRVDRREIGHLHPNGMLDIPFPVRMRRDLVASGRAEAHHMLPNTGWVTYRIRTEHDLPAAAALLRLNYERLRGAHAPVIALPLMGHVSLVRDYGDEERVD